MFWKLSGSLSISFSAFCVYVSLSWLCATGLLMSGNMLLFPQDALLLASIADFEFASVIGAFWPSRPKPTLPSFCCLIPCISTLLALTSSKLDSFPLYGYSIGWTTLFWTIFDERRLRLWNFELHADSSSASWIISSSFIVLFLTFAFAPSSLSSSELLL